MASLQAATEAVRASVGSTSTCTPATATTLSDLLLPNAIPKDSNVPGRSKVLNSTASGVKSKATKPPVRSRTKKAEQENSREHEEEHLSPKERSILATEVINATLKSLTEAIKAPAPVRRKESSKDIVKNSARKGLRRSISMPQSPQQPRTLNRVSSSPNIAGRAERSSSIASTTNSGNRATGECARVAFACLRSLSASKTTGVELPTLQIENGMSVLIGKLVTLGLDDLAVKEIRILKRRLDPEEEQPKKGILRTIPSKTEEHPIKKGISKSTDYTMTPPTLAQLLNFGKGSLTSGKLPLVITTQLQILRLMVSSPKNLDGQSALSFLQPSHHSSPTRLLLLAAKDSKPDKIPRQLQTLSELLLSLAPSISHTADSLALEPKLSVIPKIAIQLQTLALHNRILWWNLANHKGDAQKDIFDPFQKCLSAFARRSQGDALQTYHLAATAFTNLETAFSNYHQFKNQEPKNLFSGIFRILGSLAKEANLLDQAIVWAKKVQNCLDSNDSDARKCSVAAWLVGLNFRRSLSNVEDEGLLLDVLEGLERPFKGELLEIEELLTEISSLRRVVITALAKRRSDEDGLTDGLREMCENLVLMCPRFFLRYLGNLPHGSVATKEVVRYEQRRQFIRKPAVHAIDSTLFLLKTFLVEGRVSWELMDAKLQECILLAERIEGNPEEVGENEDTMGQSYHVKISNLYFTQHLNMRRDSESPKDSQPIKALKRSIDCLSSRPIHERKAAQLSVKLERMAELYKSIGRYDELFDTLMTLRDETISVGALSTVARGASTCSISAAWGQCEDTILLARTVQSLVKVQFKCLSASSQSLLFEGPWTEEERGAILEHILEVLSIQTNTTNAFIAFQAKVFQSALELYDPQSYPIRRLRVLRRLLSLDLAHQNLVTASIPDDLAQSQEAFQVEGTKDEGLHGYLAHFNLLIMSLLELRNSHPNLDVLTNCIGMWSSIRARCEDMAALEMEIDDVKHLLVHLQSVGDFLHMQGHNELRIAILRLIAEFNEYQDNSSDPNTLTLNYTCLGSQWLELGYSGKAGVAFNKAEAYSHQNGVMPHTLLQLYLAYSEYLLLIGNCSKSEEYLLRAQVCYTQGIDLASKLPVTLHQRTSQHQVISKAYLLYSKLAMERGAPQTALTQAKLSVRLLRRAWAITERLCRSDLTEAASQLDAEISVVDTSLSSSTVEISAAIMNKNPLVCGAGFWPLVTPLFRGLTHLSELYAHNGMFLETIYYAEQAQQLVAQVKSGLHIAMASAALGSWWLKAGVLDKGSEYLMRAKTMHPMTCKTREAAQLYYYFGKMQGLLGDHDAELVAFGEAEESLKTLMEATFINQIDRPVSLLNVAMEHPMDTLEEDMSKLKITKKKKVAAPRKTTARSKVPARKKAAAPAKASADPTSSIAQECPQLTSIQGSIIRQKARGLMLAKSFDDAQNLLQQATVYSTTQIDIIDHGLLMAKQLILQSIEQMDADPVYSTLQESTISFPSIVAPHRSHLDLKSSVDRLSISRVSPARASQTTRSARSAARSKSPVPDSFFDKLRQAQEQLDEVHSLAVLVAQVHVVHTVAALQNSVAILLSAAGQVNGKSLAHPGYASCSIESARNLAVRREHKVVLADSQMKLNVDDSSWPSLGLPDTKRLSLGIQHDMSRFQRDYIDIIPPTWAAISISLSDSRHELSITKFQAGQSPFVLRLPLGRNTSLDADEEIFGFEQGHAELREIIQLANESSHDARDMSTNAAKETWWEEREGLDARLRDLLENIEKVWLGGFTGIFSQHTRRVELLARFQKSFTNILDKHLPSRQKNSKRATSPRAALDPRILDLFIGLGDASAEECDFSEPLNDLLYFVVDILQFHGELNAYAEIDFDSIMIETHDALRSYHVAAKSSIKSDEGRHTILILDKALHAFPWESLPCMDGKAVSRLNSLSCLRDRILAQKDDVPEGAPAGKYISRDKISYILNPDGDLKNTQAKFSKPLQSLNEWRAIVKREPTEEEMKASLSDSELFLYFGHGCGSQYIRAREIRRLEQCAVTVLMGCSSGALVEAGEFESHGTALHYMQGGCPALVAILWDVTDRDIDRFAKSTFDHWDLYGKRSESPSRAKGKGKKRGEDKEAAAEERVSLVEAVARGRKACQLRYLTAASVVVYGVPVYFK